MGTLHCTLENRADLYVNKCQKIRHYRARSTEERRRRIIESVDSISRDEPDAPLTQYITNAGITSVARFIDQKIHAYKNKNNTGILSITLLEGQDVFAYANS